MLCECAWAAKLTKKTRLSKTYWGYVKRMGNKKATVALAHMMLRIIYNIIKNQEEYREIVYTIEEDKEKQRIRKSIKLLESKGYEVNLVN